MATKEDLIGVYTNLCIASEKHLPAFVRVLSRYGIGYIPVKLNMEEYEEILVQ